MTQDRCEAHRAAEFLPTNNGVDLVNRNSHIGRAPARAVIRAASLCEALTANFDEVTAKEGTAMVNIITVRGYAHGAGSHAPRLMKKAGIVRR